MKFYSFNGIAFSSELPLPELVTTTGESTIHIQWGRVPESLANSVRRGVCYELNEEEFLIRIPQTVSFWIRQGRQIQIDPADQADERTIRMFLYTSPFGALFHQRDLFPFHASAVETERGAVLFSGASGTGKTTIAAGFVKRGYRILNDDLTVIQPGTESPLAQCGMPYLRMWHDTLCRMGMSSEGLERTRPELKRYYFPLNGQFQNHPRPIWRIYFLNPTNQSETSFTSIRGIDKFNRLTQNTYRSQFLATPKIRNRHFQQAVEYGNAISLFQVNQSRSGFRLDELIDRIEEHFQS